MNILEYNHSNKKPLSIIVIEMLACSQEFGISNSVCTPANRLGFQCTCRKCQTSKSIWYFFSSFKWFFFKVIYLFVYLFLERGREEEKHKCVVASPAPPTEDLACNPGMCPEWESNWQPFGLQASTQSTEPHQPGHFLHSNDDSKHSIKEVLVVYTHCQF